MSLPNEFYLIMSLESHVALTFMLNFWQVEYIGCMIDVFINYSHPKFFPLTHSLSCPIPHPLSFTCLHPLLPFPLNLLLNFQEIFILSTNFLCHLLESITVNQFYVNFLKKNLGCVCVRCVCVWVWAHTFWGFELMSSWFQSKVFTLSIICPVPVLIFCYPGVSWVFYCVWLM